MQTFFIVDRAEVKYVHAGQWMFTLAGMQTASSDVDGISWVQLVIVAMDRCRVSIHCSVAGMVWLY